jgi:hypothetical protein
MAAQGKSLPMHVQKEFSEYLKCGRLEHGLLRVQCSECHHEQLVDEFLPEQPIRQWVLSFPFQLRFLFASRPELMDRVLGIVYRAISSHLIKKSGFTRMTAQTGAVTLIQRFGSALNLNVHFHMLFLDGVNTETRYGNTRFQCTTLRINRNWPIWCIPSATGLRFFLNAKVYWNAMRKIAT